jgi:hypothetical protein
MAAQSHCPAADTLERLLLGEMAEDEAAALEGHVLHCGRCTSTLHALRGEDDLVQAMRHAVTAAGPLPRGDLVDSVIERACRLEPSDEPPAACGAADTPRDGPPTLDVVPPAHEFLATPERPDEIGRLGPYRVLRVLGGGGMGIVFQAEDPQLQRCVALKVLKPALASVAANRERFLREARAVAALEHDHVVAIHQVGENRGVPFLAMPLLHGETLEERLQRQPRLPVAEAVRLGREVALALAAAHEHGLIHRDVKPANIWLEAGGDRVKVLDFGLVRGEADDTHLTQEGVVAGTPAYMAPEQVRGRPGPRSDLFSLGCVLYRLCTGVPPFRGPDTMAVLAALAQDRPAPPHALNPAVPPALSDLVLRLLAKRPEDRPASARDVAAALQDCAGPPRHRRRRWLGVAAAAAALLLLAGTVLYVNTGEGKLILEVNEPDVKVTVNGKDVRIQSPRDEITLAVGRHRLAVTKDGFTTYTDDFTIRRGGKVELTARLTRLESPELRPTSPSAPSGRDRGGPPQTQRITARPEGPAQTHGISDFREIHGADRKALQAWVDGLRSPDFRPTFVSAHVGGKGPRFNAIAIQDGRRLPYEFRLGLWGDENAAYWKRMHQNGFRHLVACHYVESEQLYEAQVWVQENRLWEGWGGDLDSLAKKIQQNRGSTLRPDYVSSAVHAGGSRFICIFADDQGLAWDYKANLDAQELRDLLAERRAKGWRPDFLHAYGDGKRPRFLVLLVENRGKLDWEAGIDLPAAAYERALLEKGRLGLRPLAVASYTANGEDRYAAVWLRYRAPAP